MRRALLDAALRLVEEKGPDGFTVAEAARAAGVSSAAPYRHFAGRRELMQALFAEGMERLAEMMTAAQSAADDTPMEQFRAMGIASIQFAADHPGYFRVMSMPEYATAEDTPVDNDRFWLRAAEVLRDPNERDDAVLFQVAARAMAHGLATMFVDGHMQRLGIDRSLATQVADRVTRAIGPAMDPPESE
ncbi:MAG: TetR/AcrR family transcriptional regulator [Myxococcota bacterium]